ncbi:putative RING-H2 finger protein ATL21A [Eucalyptus grandis]|uniref:putative RING-H2 finger protein ATL21A n=1 Tax=Eucalyptus grandis TaxID=71139 RepID=UPI00192ED30E|nr:putative RING-H2 finger protein ATL21A [Eucalyptus grandis]
MRFPFRIREVQGERCGYEGSKSRATGETERSSICLKQWTSSWTVDTIDYAHQYIRMKDPDDCLPKRILEDRFLSPSSPFEARDYEYFTLANCSSTNSSTVGPVSGIARLDCLSPARDMVVALVIDDELALSWLMQHECNLSMISVPRRGKHPMDIIEGMWWSWFRSSSVPVSIEISSNRVPGSAPRNAVSGEAVEMA